jgi:hypothetical protein
VPRYYFHLIDGQRLDDKEGRELSNLGAAMRHAQIEARTIMADELRWIGRLPDVECIEIEDEDGAIIILPFHELVTSPLRVSRHSSPRLLGEEGKK